MPTTVTLRGQQLVDFVARIDESLNTSRSTAVKDRKVAVLEKIQSITEAGLIRSPEVQTEAGDTNGSVSPITGTTRLFACAEIVSPGCTGIFSDEDLADQKRSFQPDFAIDVVIFSQSELSENDRTLRNVLDNVGDKPSPIDIAHAIKALKARGYSNKTIAKQLGITDPNKPGRLLRILRLSTEFVTAVHNGDFSVEAAVRIEDQEPPISGAIKEWAIKEFAAHRYPTAKQVHAQIDRLTPKPEGDGSGGGGGGATGDSEGDGEEVESSKHVSAEGVRKFISDYIRVVEAEDAEEFADAKASAIKGLTAFSKWLEGEISDKQCTNALDKAFKLV